MSNRGWRPAPSVALAVTLTGLGLLSSCVTETTSRGPRDFTSGVPSDAGAPRAGAPLVAGKADAATDDATGSDAAPDGPSWHLVAETQARGTIPYDNMTLPLVSHDGRYVATQTGLAPEWSTVLAEPDAPVPQLTRIEIYRVPCVPEETPRLIAILDEPAVLGRATDEAGFLIEAPRDDGSRWIGHAAWETGKIEWLVTDADAVSAFATLGRDGRLAFCQRVTGAEQFDLVVQHGDTEWRLPPAGGDWLMPTWSCAGDGHGLFALLLRGDVLDVVHMMTGSREEMRRTVRRLPLANRDATRAVAYQTLEGHPLRVRNAGEHDQLHFVHPAQLRAAVWQPPEPPIVLDRGSFAAVADANDDAFVLMSTMEDLVRRNLFDDRSRSKLVRGPYIARPTSATDRPYVLLEPADGEIGLAVMRLYRPESLR